MGNPLLLYDNVFDNGVISVTSTSSGYDGNNIKDWRGYTYWKAGASGTNYLTVVCGSARKADCLGIFGHNLYTANATISIQESTDGGTSWVSKKAGFTPTNDKAILTTFSSYTAARWRVKIETASTYMPYTAIVCVGKSLQFNRSLSLSMGNVSPHTIGIVADTKRSKTGNLLGNTIRYKPISINAVMPYDLYSFVSSTFWSFWRDHGSELKPFFWALNSTAFTEDIFLMRLTQESAYNFPMDSTGNVIGYSFQMEGVLETT